MKSKIFLLLISGSLFVQLSSCDNKEKTEQQTLVVTPADTKYSDSDSSFVKVFDNNGRVCIQKSNTYFELVDAYNQQQKTPILLKIRKTELCFEDSLNKSKVYEIEASNLPDHEPLHWKTKFVATDLDFRDNTLVAVEEGSEGEEDFISRYNLSDGKKIFSCSYGDLKIAVPNVKGKQFIGYTSTNSTTHPIQNANKENLFGLVTFSDSRNKLDEVEVTVKRNRIVDKLPRYTPEITLVSTGDNTSAIEDGKTIVMMKADENYKSSDVNGFSVHLVYYYGDDNESTTITIPVVNNRLDISNAKYDKDIFALSLSK